ncbi:tripartite tricarboxylate transporter TctB family protein [Lacrimispora indolis]|uniref:tripartite tricarboxylate transporter TctB family protein n=1 Tax=Lacrimispora indolis TaxID=69825 RepID=UPI00045E7FA8|nr:tripartite tricarboxylate transporter TctB family protein [Lacrimispora indolis]
MGDKKYIDFFSAVVTGLLSIYVIIDSIRMYLDAGEKMYYSPAFFPLILGAGLFICAGILMSRSLKGIGISVTMAQVKKSAVRVVRSETVKKALIGLCIMGIYVFALLPMLGFVISTLIFIVAMMMYMKVGSLIKIVLIAVIIVGAVYVTFQMAFGVLLP